MKIKKINKATIKKLLQDEKTVIVTDEFYSDDYSRDAESGFGNGIIQSKENFLWELDYLSFTKENNKICAFNSCVTHYIENSEIEFAN